MRAFSESELLRYDRQLLLPEIGESGQEKLRRAKVLVIGAGGLGIPVLMYLAAAGVGTLGVADDDSVELSNLHRQVLYDENEIGRKKAEVVREKLRRLNSEIEIHAFPEKFSPENALKMAAGFDLLVDGSDNFPTRYLVNDVCVKQNKPFVSGAVFQFTAQVGVFNHGNSGTYRCLFPQPPAPDESPDCNVIGAVGSVVALAGSLMANESLKILLGAGETLSGKLLTVDGLKNSFRTISFSREEDPVREIFSLPLQTARDYEVFCRGYSSAQEVKELTPVELRKMLEKKQPLQLIDVREKSERESGDLGGEWFPFEEVMKNAGKIAAGKPVVLYCRVGLRSHILIQRLQDKFGFPNLYNLKGGIKAYHGEVVAETLR